METKTKREIKNIGIVLSGGFSRGAIQLPFVKKIVEKIGYERLKVLSGSSIGAINCYSLSCQTYELMEKFYRKLDFDSTSTLKRAVKSGLFNKAFNIVEGGLKVPTYITSTRLLPFDTYYFCLNNMPREDLINTINLSMTFPFVNGPKKYKGRYFLDGGSTDNVPTYPLTYFDLDMIIICHCYPKYYPPVELLLEDKIVIDIDVTLDLDKKITSFSFTKKDFNFMVDMGNKNGEEFANYIFSDFDFDNVKERCYSYISSQIEKRNKKSGDGLMTLVDFANALYSFKGES